MTPYDPEFFDSCKAAREHADNAEQQLKVEMGITRANCLINLHPLAAENVFAVVLAAS